MTTKVRIMTGGLTVFLVTGLGSALMLEPATRYVGAAILLMGGFRLVVLSRQIREILEPDEPDESA